MLPSVRREVFHAYTDRPEGGNGQIASYEEAFGKKLRALGERTPPRDLYDVVNLYRHTDSRPTAAVLLDVLRLKCAYRRSRCLRSRLLCRIVLLFQAMWSDMLSHQLPVLPPLNDFWDALPEIFNWMTSGAPIPVRAYPASSRRNAGAHTRIADEHSPSLSLQS